MKNHTDDSEDLINLGNKDRVSKFPQIEDEFDPITKMVRDLILLKQMKLLKSWVETNPDDHPDISKIYGYNYDEFNAYINTKVGKESIAPYFEIPGMQQALREIEVEGYAAINKEFKDNFQTLKWDSDPSKNEVRSKEIKNADGEVLCNLAETTISQKTTITMPDGSEKEVSGYRSIDFPKSILENAGPMSLAMAVKDANGKNIAAKDAVYFTAHYDKAGKLVEVSYPMPIKFAGEGPDAIGYIEVNGNIYTLPVTQGKHQEMMQEVAKNKGIDLGLSQTIEQLAPDGVNLTLEKGGNNLPPKALKLNNSVQQSSLNQGNIPQPPAGNSVPPLPEDFVPPPPPPSDFAPPPPPPPSDFAPPPPPPPSDFAPPPPPPSDFAPPPPPSDFAPPPPPPPSDFAPPPPPPSDFAPPPPPPSDFAPPPPPPGDFAPPPPPPGDFAPPPPPPGDFAPPPPPPSDFAPPPPPQTSNSGVNLKVNTEQIPTKEAPEVKLSGKDALLDQIKGGLALKKVDQQKPVNQKESLNEGQGLTNALGNALANRRGAIQGKEEKSADELFTESTLAEMKEHLKNAIKSGDMDLAKDIADYEDFDNEGERIFTKEDLAQIVRGVSNEVQNLPVAKKIISEKIIDVIAKDNKIVLPSKDRDSLGRG